MTIVLALIAIGGVAIILGTLAFIEHRSGAKAAAAQPPGSAGSNGSDGSTGSDSGAPQIKK